MKASSEKSSSTTSTTTNKTASRPFFAKAGGGNFFAPAATAPCVQTKMEVNKPGDKFEQEADQMAEKVMRMPAPASPVNEEKLQRQSEEQLQKKEEEKLQKAPATEEKLQRQGDGVPAVGASTQSAIQNKTSGGQPLSSDVRSYMEQRFGQDFSAVRVHNDAGAAQLNRELNAQAFTHGQNVYFGEGKYSPESGEGKRLLAHELAHVVQQLSIGQVTESQSMTTSTIHRAEAKTAPGSAQLAGAMKASSPHDPAKRMPESPLASQKTGSGPTMRSPYQARMAGAIAQREPKIVNKSQDVPTPNPETIIQVLLNPALDSATKIVWMLTGGVVDWYYLKMAVNVIPDNEINATLKQLNVLGQLDRLLKAIPSKEFEILGKFYYKTNDNEAKEKIANYYKIPGIQAEGMAQLEKDREMNDIEMPGVPLAGLQNEDVSQGYLNKKYWEKKKGYCTFKLKSGKRPSEGIKKIFEGPTRLDCGAIVIALHYRTLLETLGQEEFDKRFSKDPNKEFVVSPFETPLYPSYLEQLNLTSETKEAEIQKGDWIYFRNHPKYKFKHPAGEASGENTFCMGKNEDGENQYLGFGLGEAMTEKKVIDWLTKAYDADRSDSDRAVLAGILGINRSEIFSDLELDAWIYSNRSLKSWDYNYITTEFPKKIEDEKDKNKKPQLDTTRARRFSAKSL